MYEKYTTFIFYIFALCAVVFIALGITSNHYEVMIFGFMDYLHHEFYFAWCFLMGVALFLSWHLLRRLFEGRKNTEVE